MVKISKLQGLVALLSLCPVTAVAGQLNLTTGAYYSSGDYGQPQPTDTRYYPVTAQYLTSNWNLKLTVPYISVTGIGDVLPGTGTKSGSGGLPPPPPGTLPPPPPPPQRTTNQGLGDVLAQVGYGASTGAGFHELSTIVKFGTANSEQGLGTGENDYSIQWESAYGTSTVSPFLTLGYQFTGNSANSDYHDIGYASAGITFGLGDSLAVGLNGDYYQSIQSGSDPSKQAGLYFSWSITESYSISGSYSRGYSDGSPDFAGGLFITAAY